MKTDRSNVKPFLKWAGGKKQLLPELGKYVPKEYGQYIEPFLGGGALFFHLRPDRAILADSNKELIDCYQVVRDNVENLILELQGYKNNEAFYYRTRDLDPDKLSPIKRAARTIYLNKTGYNGLYRVNKAGKFNVPFGRRLNPQICNASVLWGASEALQGTKLVAGDYKTTLQKYAKKGDFIYLDPPYYPAGGYAEFKRYTKEFFYEEDHVELHELFSELAAKGCNVLLTNSNTDFVRRLYSGFEYRAINARRSISCDASTRHGEDLIIFGTPTQNRNVSQEHLVHGRLLEHFPGTRLMGSKYRVLSFIWQCVQDLSFDTVLDAFSGSGAVSYMFKQYGKQVYSNDFMHFAYYFAKALIENSEFLLGDDEVKGLMKPNRNADRFISQTFAGLYFTEAENRFLDSIRTNIDLIAHPLKCAIALAALTRACMKRRPRGVFTFVGERYDDGRRDMRLTLQEHFIENVRAFNRAVFSNKRDNYAFHEDVFDLDVSADLVYIDPPYVTPHSDNDYVRRYHFVEGLVRRWQGLEIQEHTRTKKFRSYKTPFATKDTICGAFDRLFEKFSSSILVVSHSSNSLPNKADLVSMLKKHKKHVHAYQVPLTYSYGNQGFKVGDNANRVLEYVFVAYD
jgi:DNA adenine methylase